MCVRVCAYGGHRTAFKNHAYEQIPNDLLHEGEPDHHFSVFYAVNWQGNQHDREMHGMLDCIYNKTSIFMIWVISTEKARIAVWHIFQVTKSMQIYCAIMKCYYSAHWIIDI